jgi:hypothetical protein
MTPEQQQQFNQELQMVIAVAAQIYPAKQSAFLAVDEAFNIVKMAEGKLKGYYEPAKEAPVQASTGVGAEGDRVGQGAGESKPAVPTGAPKPSRKVINDSITECSRIILAKKLRTQEQLVKMLEAYGVKNKNQLTDEQAERLLGELNEITKE